MHTHKYTLGEAIKTLAASALLFTASLQAQLQPGDLIAITGDSITEQRKYSIAMEQYLTMCQPVEDLAAFQVGWGGEQASGMAYRFSNDLAPFQPDVVTTCYGMNDGRYRPVSEDLLENYRKHTTNYVQQMKAAGIRWIIVGSPGAVDPVTYKRSSSTAEEYNHALQEMGRVAKEVAEAEGVSYVDIFTPMMTGIEKATALYGEGYKISYDGVHPNDNGHLAMAYGFLKALGCEGSIGRIEFDYASGSATADSAQTILSASEGSIELESTRYPYCFRSSDGHESDKTMADLIGFNDELNRYLLVVKNSPAKVKVTWGNESREYTSAQLAAGVNLAADFSDHPFKSVFSSVTRLIHEQQNFEQTGIKRLLNSFINWEKYFPENTDDFTVLKNLVLEKDAEMRARVRAAIVPVKHTILIQPIS